MTYRNIYIKKEDRSKKYVSRPFEDLAEACMAAEEMSRKYYISRALVTEVVEVFLPGKREDKL